MATSPPFKGFYIRAEKHITQHYTSDTNNCTALEICKAVRNLAYFQYGLETKHFDTGLCKYCQQFFLALPDRAHKHKERPENPLADLVLALTRFLHQDLIARKRETDEMRTINLVLARMRASRDADQDESAYPAEMADLHARYKEIARTAIAASAAASQQEIPALDMLRECIAALIA